MGCEPSCPLFLSYSKRMRPSAENIFFLHSHIILFYLIIIYFYLWYDHCCTHTVLSSNYHIFLQHFPIQHACLTFSHSLAIFHLFIHSSITYLLRIKHLLSIMARIQTWVSHIPCPEKPLPAAASSCVCSYVCFAFGLQTSCSGGKSGMEMLMESHWQTDDHKEALGKQKSDKRIGPGK